MDFFYTTILLTAICAVSIVKAQIGPLAYTNYGYVLGSFAQSRNSREFFSFRGIPFATPPVGDLRFKAPEPPTIWQSPYNATVDGPSCIQRNLIAPGAPIEGQEDCLYLNIYVPNVDSPELLPVMFWIYGGAFIFGSAQSFNYGPELLMDKDVIVVTANYRVGALGFLTTRDDEAPGNFGLKDQVQALRFVQENIGYFGGDNNRVTIFGQSAGGASVSLLMVSPIARGLFQQAISESGVNLDSFVKPRDVSQDLDVTYAQAGFVGCGDSVGNSKDLIDCLRTVDAVDFVDTLINFPTPFNLSASPFSIVVETKTEINDEPFLEKSALDYLLDGEFLKIPWIVGDVQDEGIFLASPLINDPNVVDAINQNVPLAFLSLLQLEQSAKPEDIDELANNITDFYLEGDNFLDLNDSRKIQNFIDMFTDRYFAYGTYQNIILQSLQGHDSIWLYNFDYRGQFSFHDVMGKFRDLGDFHWGVTHSDDTLYLFYNYMSSFLGEFDWTVSESFVTLWTNFAIYGDPDPNGEFNWEKIQFPGVEDVNIYYLNFLNITGSAETNSVVFRNQTGFHPRRVDFWSQQKIVENENFP